MSVATLAYHLAGHLLRPLLTLRLAELGAGDALIGVIVAVNPLVSVVLALPSGRFLDRVGSGRVLRWSMAAMAVGGLGYGWAGTVGSLLALQVTTGVAELGTWLGLQSAITQAGEGEFRARHLSLFALAWSGGLAFGPSIGGAVYQAYGFRALGWCYCGLAAIGAVAIAFGPAMPRVEPVAGAPVTLRGAVGQVLHQPAVRGVLVATFGCLAIGSLRSTYYPLFLERQGISLARIGLLLSAYGIAALLVRAALPWLLRRAPPARILVAGLTLATCAMGATPLLARSTILLGIAAAIAGAGTGVMPPITVDLLARATPSTVRGVAMATRVMTNRAALFVQPLLFGGIAGLAGLAAGFAGTTVLLVGLTAWTAIESRRSGINVLYPKSDPA